jgi:hypothetical protein
MYLFVVGIMYRSLAQIHKILRPSSATAYARIPLRYYYGARANGEYQMDPGVQSGETGSSMVR